MKEMKQFIETGKSNSIQQDDQDAKGSVLLKFWEIDRFFKCPVVGMCLTLSEQKKLLRKTGFSIKKKSPFEIHEMLVASSESESQLSRRVDKLLNQKFGKKAVSLINFDHREFMAHCKAAFENGDLSSALWAAVINQKLPIKSKKELFGIVHMTMHLSGEQHMIQNGKLAGLQKELSDMRQRIKDAAGARRLLQKENESLRRNQAKLDSMIDRAEREKNRLKETLAELESRKRIVELEQENRRLNKELDVLFGNFNKKQHQADSLKEKNMRLLAELERQPWTNRYFKKESREIMGEVCTLNSCDASCPSFDLCKKRVLIVGGITRMESQYRQLVETSGGIFEYHDGYMKKGVKKLEYSFRRADVVLCPVSCNSHAACFAVKNLAKKYNKTVYMLANSSLSTVYQTIQGSAGASVN